VANERNNSAGGRSMGMIYKYKEEAIALLLSELSWLFFVVFYYLSIKSGDIKSGWGDFEAVLKYEKYCIYSLSVMAVVLVSFLVYSFFKERNVKKRKNAAYLLLFRIMLFLIFILLPITYF